MIPSSHHDARSRPGSGRRTRRRGRAALVWALVAFAGLQLFVSRIIDHWESGLRDSEYGRKLSLLRARIAEHPDQPLVLALGTSRTAYGLRPAAMSGVTVGETEPLLFNFGVLGGGPLYELVFLNRLLGEGIRPATVLIEVHPPLLHDVPDLEAVLAPVVERCDARDLAILRRFAARPIRLYAEWLRLRLAPCHWYRYVLLTRAAPRWVTEPPRPDIAGLTRTDPFGWVPYPFDPPGESLRQERSRQTVAAYESAIRDYAVSDVPDRALREMLDVCRRAQIDAALLIMPEESEYRRTFATRTQARAEAYLDALCGDYGVPLFDAREWCGDSDFGDAQHLLRDGAGRFSAMFAGDRLRPWLTAKRDGPAASVARQPGSTAQPR
ncbi:MAG TPA: hypothetical protein VMV69_12200 [Pirellulales bacterium]|nr:hypothetical protein [Pirellulales bacterium]